MTAFHLYLRMCRMQNGLSLKEVSEALDISESLLYQYETNKNFPSGKNLIKLARFYHFSLDQLFDIAPTIVDDPPLYNTLGQRIVMNHFPWPHDASYYQLSSRQIVLVKNEHRFRNGQPILAFYQEKTEVFYVTHHDTKFFLLSTTNRLFPLNDHRIKTIGPILQFIKIVEK